MNRLTLLLALAFLNSSAFSFPREAYPVPPANNTSLTAAVKLPVMKSKLVRHRRYSGQVKHAHKRIQLTHSPTGLFVYYALPATACCGGNWQINITQCCAHAGKWETSPYATFNAGKEDLIYSASNDDAYLSWDAYRQVQVDSEIDDPASY